MAHTGPRRRSGKRTVAHASSSDVVQLDDNPVSLLPSRDGKRLVVVLPYELWILDAKTFELQRTIEVPAAHPSVVEAYEDGILWIGGPHLHRGSLWTTTVSKIGSKLGGYVDTVCLVRPHLLCGTGNTGEILLDLATQDVGHRRKAGEHIVLGLVPSADGRAVWTEGLHHAWVIDPEHLSGYMQLKLRATSETDVADEAIVALGTTPTGGVILAARDGAVGWTNRSLRLLAERHVRDSGAHLDPLSITADDRWIYVLRPRGLLHRFLMAQPKPERDEHGELIETEPLPEAEGCRLDRLATRFAMLSENDGHGTLVLAGPTADGQLGRLWRVDPGTLPWKPLSLRERTLVEHASQPGTSRSFVAMRSKIQGAPLSDAKVDDIIGGSFGFLVVHGHGNILEHAAAARTTEEVLPGDTLILPAMVRFHTGTARPALLVWPGAPDDTRGTPDISWLTWGDRPRGWIPLSTPAIRQQGWSRRDVFPLQVATPTPPPLVAGVRAAIPERWTDPELFAALAQECKHLLKVIW